MVQIHSTALLVGRSRDRSPMVSLGVHSEATDGTMCPGVDSASKNEYQENSWGKDCRCLRVTTLPPSYCLTSRKSRSLNLPGPQGPVQACNEETLPLPFINTSTSLTEPFLLPSESSTTSMHFCHSTQRHIPKYRSIFCLQNVTESRGGGGKGVCSTATGTFPQATSQTEQTALSSLSILTLGRQPGP
jgi:hypothetical protein